MTQPVFEKLLQLQSKLLAMNPDTQVTEVLTIIAEEANRLLGGHFSVVMPYKQENDQFLVEQFTAGGAPEAKAFEWTGPRSHGTARTALSVGVWTVENYDKEIESYPFLKGGPGAFREVADIKALIGIRLEAGGERVGVLFVNYPAPHRATEEELQIARLFASQAAVAIQNARLFEAERQAERELNSVIQVAQSLMREALRPGIQLNQFLQYVIEQTLNLLEFEAGWLLLREGEWVRVVATDEHHLDDVGQSFPVEDCISGMSMLRKEAINIPDLSSMPQEYRQVYKAPRGRRMKSELVVPLMVGDRAIGAFNIESDRQTAFEPRHVEMLKLLSDHAALTIELAQSREEAFALSDVGLDLSRQTEMDAVVRSSLAHALRLVQGQFGQILLREGEKLVVRYTTNDPPTDLNLSPLVNDCVSGLAVLERKPVIVPNVDRPDYYVTDWIETPAGRKGVLTHRATETPRYKRALEAEKERMHAEFAVPVLPEGIIIGVLNVETPRESGFRPEQREDLVSFATSNAGRFAGALLEGRDVLDELLRGALVRADTTFGQILSLDGEELVIEHTTGSERAGTRVSVSKSVTGRAVRSGKPVYVPDVMADPDYQRYLGEEMKSELVVPLVIGEEVIGVLNVESPIPGFFSLDHARILEAFAGQAAVAVDRAKKFETQTLAEVGGLAGDIVHRLNNPLGAISMRLELLQGKGYYPAMIADYPYLGKFVEQVERNINGAKAIVQELRTTLKGKEPGPTDLGAMIREALGRADLPGNVQVEVSLPDRVIQVIANERLANVFWNLFDNARKAMMPDGGKLTITADISTDSQWATVEVRDTGQGIEPWRLDLIFEPGESTTREPGAPVHGLGLWWTKAQVENFGGTIAVESQIGLGTCVTLKLRKAASCEMMV